MRQSASLKICVLGGRSFGKTSLLSSLIAISGTKDAGIIALGDNQRKLAIYNDYKGGHGKLSATSWDDICQFRYKITGSKNQRWVVSFIDYPGEFFQKFFEDEDSGVLNGVLAKLRKSGQAGKAKQDDLSYGGESKNAKRILKEILSADALVVLLPADSERTEYKKLLTTFKARLESLLQTIEERNPYIPVCLAINKSDMLEDTAVEDLFERPVFAGFHNMLTRERGQNYFYQTVSAFGGNRANGLPPGTENIEDLRQTWDGKSEPQNVLPMLIRISEMAEEGRYKLLRERFNKASAVARTLKWPFSWFHVRGLGANKEEDRKYCVKNLAKCAVCFGIFTLISAFSVFCAISAACSLNAWVGLCGYDKELSAAKQSCKGDGGFILGKNDIEKLSKSRPSQLGRLVFFCNQKLNDLKKRYEDLEDDRNSRVFKSALDDCRAAKLCDGGDGMDVDERLKRFDARIARYQNVTNEIFGSETRIAADGRLKQRNADDLRVAERIVLLVEKESVDKQSLENDEEFFQDLKNVNDANEKDFCRVAESFLQKYQNAKEHLTNKCEDIRGRLNAAESNLTAKADTYLNNHADQPDSEDYKNRISRAEARMGCVSNLLDQISTKSTYRGKYDGEKQKAKDLIKDINNDKPCYDALATLRKENGNVVTGKVKRIHAFLRDYAKYGRCERFMVPLRCECSNELSRIQSDCHKSVTNNCVKASQPTAEKIKRTQNQIFAYQTAYNEYVIGSKEFREAKEKIEDLKKSLQGYENCKRLEDSFAADLKKVYESDETTFCCAAERFLEMYKNAREQFKDQYGKLEKEKKTREENAEGELKRYLNAHMDDENSADCQNRICQAKDRIEKIKSFIETIGLKSSLRSSYVELKSGDEKLVTDLQNDEPFYTALAALREQNQKEVKGKVRRTNAFLTKYGAYARCKRFWTSVCNDLSNEVCRIQSECRVAVTNNSLDVSGISTGKKIERIKNQITAYTNARDEYVIGSNEFSEAEKSIRRLKQMLADAQGKDQCEKALREIKEASYDGRLRKLAGFMVTYKDTLTDENKTEIEELEKDALKHWQDYQNTNESRYAVKDDDALNVQMQHADELEKVYSTLMNQMPSNSPRYTWFEQKKNELSFRKQSIARDQELENAFRALPSTNTVERCLLLNAIDAFESKYHIAHYTSKHGKGVFVQLRRRKDEAQRAFLSDYTNQIAKVQCPSETNFLGRCQWADTCMKISEESYKGLGSNNVIRLRLEADYKHYANQHQRFAKFFRLASLANEIASKSPTNEVRIACDRLSEIKKFYSDYRPEDKHDPLVGGYYLKVQNAREKNDAVVSLHIDKELAEMDAKLPYGASEEKKIEVWNKELDLLGKFIPKFVERTNPHTIYEQKRKDLQGRFSVAQRKELFNNDYMKLLAGKEKEQDLELKSQLIRAFLDKNGDVRSNDFASEKIRELEIEAGRIKKDIEFNKYNEELDTVVKDRPTEDAGDSAFTKFKARIVSLQGELGKFKQSQHLKHKCQGVDQKLQDQLAYVEKALGDGSWKDIQKKEEEYKANPCKDTEKKLRSALTKFDEKRFGKYLASKKETEERFDKDLESRKDVLRSKGEFFKNPGHLTFVDFKNAVDECRNWENGQPGKEGYGCKWPFLDECFRYILKIQNGIQVKLEVESVSFSGPWKKVGVCVAEQPVCELFKEYCRHNFGVVRVDSSGLRFSVKYENHAAYREVSKAISFWELLKDGATSGSCRTCPSFEVIEKMWGKNPKEYTGTLVLSIEEIPRMP